MKYFDLLRALLFAPKRKFKIGDLIMHKKPYEGEKAQRVLKYDEYGYLIRSDENTKLGYGGEWVRFEDCDENYNLISR